MGVGCQKAFQASIQSSSFVSSRVMRRVPQSACSLRKPERAMRAAPSWAKPVSSAVR